MSSDHAPTIHTTRFSTLASDSNEASRKVALESLMYRTSFTVATGSRRCGPWADMAARRASSNCPPTILSGADVCFFSMVSSVLGSERFHRGLELATTLLIVLEQVEAGAGRAQQDHVTLVRQLIGRA